MKKLAGLVIILAVFILGGYYGMGVLTEGTIKKNIDVVNQSQSRVFLEVEQYRRGWFTSDAIMKWRLHFPERVITSAGAPTQTLAARDYQMEMPVVIHHGPFIFANHGIRFGLGYMDTVLTLPEPYKQKFEEDFAKDSTMPTFNLSIFINYLNKSKAKLINPSFQIKAKNGQGYLNWMGASAAVNMSSDKSDINGKVLVDGFVLSRADARTLTFDKIASDFHMRRAENGLYLGNANFSVGSLDFIDKEKKIFEVKDFRFNSDNAIEDKLFHVDFKASLESMMLNEETYGPGNVEFSLRNLDAEVLADINEQLKTMQQGADTTHQKDMLSLLPKLPKLFNKGAEFVISRCTFKVPTGEIDGKLRIALPKGDSSNPFELIQKIEGQAKLKMPKALVKQLVLEFVAQRPEGQPLIAAKPAPSTTTPPTPTATTTPQQSAEIRADKEIEAMEQKALLVGEGTDYVTELKWEQGKLTVNGKPYPL